MIKSGQIILILMILPLFVFTQTRQSTSAETVKIKDDKQSRKVESGLSDNSAQKQKTHSARQQLSLLKQKRNKEQQRQLLPALEDISRFAAFLQQSKTGLIKLTNDIGCEPSRYVLRADEECLRSIPGGSFYSFREREYSSSALADIRLKDKLFITDGFFSQNILVNLGNIPLENVSVNSKGMKFLVDFIPETDAKSATGQYITITRGIKSDGFEYRKVFPAVVNSTYAMRLVAYRGRLIRVQRGFAYNVLSDDDRSDVILAFRVVRSDNESVTLLWKELERRKAPRITVSH